MTQRPNTPSRQAFQDEAARVTPGGNSPRLRLPQPLLLLLALPPYP